MVGGFWGMMRDGLTERGEMGLGSLQRERLNKTYLGFRHVYVAPDGVDVL